MISSDPVDFATIYNKSLDLVSRREHSCFELEHKLLRRYGMSSSIDDVIAKLKESRLLDDHRFAETYIQARARRGFGPKKIFIELKQRGLQESIINSGLASIENWNELALAAFHKKFTKFSNQINEILKAKNFLQNRGFSFEQIEICFKET
ncbi:MAG: regulatory protein RecX [Gammaproteobacteria bacterium]